MATDRLEREQALNTIAELRQQQRQLYAEQHLHMPRQDAARLTQHIAELDNQVADLALSNDELSTDLGRALDVAQRVMDQKSKLQEQCQVQEQQLTQWQLEAQRVKELEGGFLLLSFHCFSATNAASTLDCEEQAVPFQTPHVDISVAEALPCVIDAVGCFKCGALNYQPPSKESACVCVENLHGPGWYNYGAEQCVSKW